MPDLAAQMPSALRAVARWERFARDIPVLLAHPGWEGGTQVPVVIWMHGRTVNKELDPGRYLRWIRAGLGVCAVDLPGHGERFDSTLQDPAHTLDVIEQMLEEVDDVVTSLGETGVFDMSRAAIGGMSAGGMVTLARLCRPHPFVCTSVEATSGSWEHQRHRAMFRDRDADRVDAHNPMTHMDGWREIPLQAFHTRQDEWVAWEGQESFLTTLTARYADPSQVDVILYETTGAPYEHAGFGRYAADAKNRQVEFLASHLAPV